VDHPSRVNGELGYLKINGPSFFRHSGPAPCQAKDTAPDLGNTCAIGQMECNRRATTVDVYNLNHLNFVVEKKGFQDVPGAC
jgi:hypothetical protein